MDKEISKQIKAIRVSHGFKSQQSFADALHVHLKTVQGWEKESNPILPDLDNLLSMCAVLDCDLDYLIGRIKEKTHDIKTVCGITGLSENAVTWISNLDKDYLAAFDQFILHEEFKNMMDSYVVFLKLLNDASERFDPGTTGASIGVGIEAPISVEQDGSVTVSSIWQVLSLIGHDVGFYAELITDNDRMKLWNKE